MEIKSKEKEHCSCIRDVKTKKVLSFKKRMLVWDSPVEFVNNMYGAHPDEDSDGNNDGDGDGDGDGNDYFSKIFSSKE
jgi:hypothetical protein